MVDSTEATPVLRYVIQVQDREFLLAIFPNGMSVWDDHTGRRRLRHPHDRHMELSALAGDPGALRRLQHECVEFAIEVPVSKAILAKAAEIAQEELRPNPHLSISLPHHVAAMDNLLKDYFWRMVNPLLSVPLAGNKLV